MIWELVSESRHWWDSHDLSFHRAANLEYGKFINWRSSIASIQLSIDNSYQFNLQFKLSLSIQLVQFNFQFNYKLYKLIIRSLKCEKLSRSMIGFRIFVPLKSVCLQASFRQSDGAWQLGRPQLQSSRGQVASGKSFPVPNSFVCHVPRANVQPQFGIMQNTANTFPAAPKSDLSFWNTHFK